MEEKILFVDDEQYVLDSMRRQLRRRFNIITAISGEEALRKCKEEGPFAVVVSDMRMPEMDGVELLAIIKDLYPDTTRLMLTGNSDQETATEAVNKGQIFKFLNKPCPIPVLVTSLALAVRQHKLVTVEKDVLDKTLKGLVKVLSELLSFTNPLAFSSGLRIRSLVLQVAEKMSVENLWQLEIASLMCQIGCVTLPAEIITKQYSNMELTESEQLMFASHPTIGSQMLENIPRLEGVSQIIHNQFKDYGEYNSETEEDDEVGLGAQILRSVFDYDLLIYQGISHLDALRQMKERAKAHNPSVLKHLRDIPPPESFVQVANLRVKELLVGMVVEEDIFSKNETLVVPKGIEITVPVLQGIVNFSRQIGIKEPIKIKM